MARLCRRHPFVDLLLYSPPAGKDGFLATNSLLGFTALLTRAYAAEFGSDADWPNAAACLKRLLRNTAGARLAGFHGATDEGSASLLEVRTLGERGLYYRHRLRRGISDWMHLKAVSAPRLADACGSGDWCTAGLIAKGAVGGQKGLRSAGARGVRAALQYGQALAAWNCYFEGARGGMYAVSQDAFETQIAGLQDGRLAAIDEKPDGGRS